MLKSGKSQLSTAFKKVCNVLISRQTGKQDLRALSKRIFIGMWSPEVYKKINLYEKNLQWSFAKTNIMQSYLEKRPWGVTVKLCCHKEKNRKPNLKTALKPSMLKK